MGSSDLERALSDLERVSGLVRALSDPGRDLLDLERTLSDLEGPLDLEGALSEPRTWRGSSQT